MEEKKDNKIKVWYEEHKDGIKTSVKRLGYCAVGVGIGYFVGTKRGDYLTELGLSAAHAMGYLKFFNPDTGAEVDAITYNRLLVEKCKELKG
jgi:hypothetical protein